MSSLLKRTSSQSFIYLVSLGAGMAMSIISFPLLTRIFSLREYGDMALVNAVLPLLVAFGKGGLSSSLIRFYPDYDSAPEQKKMFCSTSFLGAFALSALTLLLFWLVLLAFRGAISGTLEKIFMLAGALAVLKSMQALYIGFERAEERVLYLSSVNFIFKAGSLAMGVFFFLFVVKSLYGYFLGMTVFFAGLMFYLLFTVYKKGLLSFRAFSPQVMKQIYKFGIPLSFYELSDIVNDFSDRFLIKYFLGSAQVAIYAAGSNLSLYIMQLLSSSVGLTVFPIYSRLWKTEGREATRQYLAVVLKYYFCIGVPVFFITSAVSRDMMTVLATAKYAASARVVPWVIGGAVIFGSVPIMNASFYLTKQTGKLAAYLASCAALNFVANLFVIPAMGIMGAAYTSTFSYLLLTVLLTLSSRKILDIPLPIKDVIFYSAFSLVAAVATEGFRFHALAATLLARLGSGFSVYAVCLLLYDPALRKAAAGLWTKMAGLKNKTKTKTKPESKAKAKNPFYRKTGTGD